MGWVGVDKGVWGVAVFVVERWGEMEQTGPYMKELVGVAGRGEWKRPGRLGLRWVEWSEMD